MPNSYFLNNGYRPWPNNVKNSNFVPLNTSMKAKSFRGAQWDSGPVSSNNNNSNAASSSWSAPKPNNSYASSNSNFAKPWPAPKQNSDVAASNNFSKPWHTRNNNYAPSNRFNKPWYVQKRKNFSSSPLDNSKPWMPRRDFFVPRHMRPNVVGYTREDYNTIVNAHNCTEFNDEEFLYRFDQQRALKESGLSERNAFWFYYNEYPEYYWLRTCTYPPGECRICDNAMVEAIKLALKIDSYRMNDQGSAGNCYTNRT